MLIGGTFCQARPVQSDTLVVLKEKDLRSTQATITELENLGVRVLHVFPPRTLICSVPAELEAVVLAHGAVAHVHRTPVDPPDETHPFADAASGVRAWNHLVAPPPRDHRKGPALTLDNLPAPQRAMSPQVGGTGTASAKVVAGSPRPASIQTSEFMIGKVAVGIILPESAGANENWSSARQDTVIQKITAGCNWWATMGTNAHLTFYYDVHRSVPTRYEPIELASSQDSLWISEVLSNMGYSGADTIVQNDNYLNAVRSQLGTDWAFSYFVVDDLNDANSAFSDGFFAYTYVGGPRTVMTYNNGGWNIANMDLVAAHEMGHIFWAADEYCQVGYSCCDFNSYGYLNIPNSNCAYNNPASVDCMMLDNSPVALCAFSRQQIGWKDSNSNGLYDPADTTVALSFDTASSGPTFVFSGVAADQACPSPTHTPCTINKITNVWFRLDQAAWQLAAPADGAFNSSEEAFGFTVGPLAFGTHVVDVLAANSVGKTTTGSWSVTNTDATRPNPPTLVTDDGAKTYALTSLHASWSGANDPESGIAEYQYAIGTSPTDPGTGYLAGWTSVGLNTSVTKSGLSLSPGKTYYFYVKARNGAAAWSSTATPSDGILASQDSTAPKPPASVTDDGAATTSTSSLHALWAAASDPESGIAEYQYAIGTTHTDPGAGYTVGWTSTGAATSVTKTGLSLRNGTTYYFYVKARNGANLWSPVAISDGVQVKR